MTRGPVPPHERAWRHPSELAAPPHEPTSRIGHLLIASTAAVSLLLVGWLAISMTPHRYGDADRVVIATSEGSGTPGLALGSPGTIRLRSADGVLRTVSTFLAAQRAAPQSTAGVRESYATTFASDLAGRASTASAADSLDSVAGGAALEAPTTAPTAVAPDSTPAVGSEPVVLGAEVPATAADDNLAVAESGAPGPGAAPEPSGTTAPSGPPTSPGSTSPGSTTPSSSTSSSSTSSSSTSSTSTSSTSSTSTSSTSSTTAVTQPPKQLAG